MLHESELNGSKQFKFSELKLLLRPRNSNIMKKFAWLCNT